MSVPYAPEVVATLDGSRSELGTTMNSDDLAAGSTPSPWLPLMQPGTSASETMTFTTIGRRRMRRSSSAPEDGATGVATTAQAQGTATRPADEPLSVTFLRRHPRRCLIVAGARGTTGARYRRPRRNRVTLVDPQAVAESDDVYVESAPTTDSPYQRYDVRVGRVRGAKTVDLSWEGRMAADREVVLSV